MKGVAETGLTSTEILYAVFPAFICLKIPPNKKFLNASLKIIKNDKV